MFGSIFALFLLHVLYFCCVFAFYLLTYNRVNNSNADNESLSRGGSWYNMSCVVCVDVQMQRWQPWVLHSPPWNHSILDGQYKYDRLLKVIPGRIVYHWWSPRACPLPRTGPCSPGWSPAPLGWTPAPRAGPRSPGLVPDWPRTGPAPRTGPIPGWSQLPLPPSLGLVPFSPD